MRNVFLMLLIAYCSNPSKEISFSINELILNTDNIVFTIECVNQSKKGVYLYTPIDELDFCSLITQIQLIREGVSYSYDPCSYDSQHDEISIKNPRVVFIGDGEMDRFSYDLALNNFRDIHNFKDGDLLKVIINYPALNWKSDKQTYFNKEVILTSVLRK